MTATQITFLGRWASGGRACVLGALLAAGPAAWSEEPVEVYVSRGEHGEVSYSDTAAPGAEPVTLLVDAAAEDPAGELDRRVEQMLSVANALEASRLARERARAEARAAAAAAEARAAPDVVYQDRYVVPPYLLRVPHDPRHFDGRRHDGFRGGTRFEPGRGHGDEGRPERSMSRTLVYDPE